jgi:hypothetical protein
MPSLPKRVTAVKTTVEASVTFQSVLRGTPPNRFANAEKVKITKVRLTKKGGQLTKVVADSYTPGSSSKYESEIEFLPSKKIKLSCSCDDFVYRFEWVLYRKGSADLVYGNGEPPDETNPARTLGCCKHIIALRDHLISKNYIEPTA